MTTAIMTLLGLSNQFLTGRIAQMSLITNLLAARIAQLSTVKQSFIARLAQIINRTTLAVGGNLDLMLLAPV